MLHKSIFFSLLCAAALMISACGGGGSSSSDGSGSTSKGSGTTHSTGTFKVFVPDGWLAIPFQFNGEHNPNAVGIYKGAKSEYDMLSCPGIQIYIPATKGRVPTDKSDYDDVTELEPWVLDNYTWKGFTGTYRTSSLGILMNDGDDGYQVSVYMKVATSNKTISVNDADVKAIVASIKPE